MCKYSIAIVILCCLLPACQAAKEFHYFKQGDNYYRIKIKEKAFLSSSRYESGYFDEVALDNYFGQIHRADSTGNIQNLNSPSTATKKDSNSVIPGNTSLVLILSTDASVVADQISSFAQNEQTLDLLAQMANTDVSKENQQLTQQISSLSSTTSNIVQYGTSVIPGLKVPVFNSFSQDTAALIKQLTTLISYAASQMGKTATITNFNDAYTWYLDQFSKK